MSSVTLEAKGYTNKYLSDCIKVIQLSGALEDNDTISESLSQFLDGWICNQSNGCEHLLENLSLINTMLINNVDVPYINYYGVEDPIKHRPCSKLFEIFEEDPMYQYILNMFSDNRDVMEVFNNIPSPTFAMVATYRVLYDALYYERLQHLKLPNKKLFMYLIDTSWMTAYMEYLDCSADVFLTVQNLPE